MDLDVLRQLKRQKKMTNKQLSQASGVPLGTINKLMSGVTDNPKLPTVQAIARAMGTTVDGIAGSAAAPENASGMPALSLREQQLLSILRRLDDRGFDTVLSAAQAQLALLNAVSPEETDSVGHSDHPSLQTTPEPSRNGADPLTPPVREQLSDAVQPEGIDDGKKAGKADKAGRSGKMGKTGKGRKAVKEAGAGTDAKENRKGKKGKKHKG